MSFSELRRKRQIEFLESKEEIEVGEKENLPISVEKLYQTTAESPWVVGCISSGLTAVVYKIKVDNKFYNLKKKREEILVKNIDGQTSFLNEIQRRRDFEQLKKSVPELREGIVDTIYASLNTGVILSPWIEGTHIKEFNKEIYESLFKTLYYMDINGIFEWDLCSGNLLLTETNQVKLFDFGYCYLFNPLTEYNSDGKESPIFHGAERFESRMFMQFLMDMEQNNGLMTTLDAYRVEKEIALKYSIKKLNWLKNQRADHEVLNWVNDRICIWEKGLKSDLELKKLYILESFRSYVLDLHDDISGKSCTINTIKKEEKILQYLNNNYEFLKENHGFFWSDEFLTKSNIIEKYESNKQLVLKYQITKK